jgi:hypothetical protein
MRAWLSRSQPNILFDRLSSVVGGGACKRCCCSICKEVLPLDAMHWVGCYLRLLSPDESSEKVICTAHIPHILIMLDRLA